MPAIMGLKYNPGTGDELRCALHRQFEGAAMIPFRTEKALIPFWIALSRRCLSAAQHFARNDPANGHMKGMFA